MEDKRINEPMTAVADPSHSVGRVQTSDDEVTAGPLNRLCATLDRDDPPFSEGDVIPPLAHWLFFLPADRQSELGEDGHAGRGAFLPAAPDLPRRMWAGSRISFIGPIRVGMKLCRRSEIVSVRQKEGTSGPLMFVTERHEIAERDGPVLLADEHDIVYRAAKGEAGKPASEVVESGAWQRSLVADERLLFRYSALTFNGHRIHYDKDYATKAEGYRGLVVHGPLVATLMMDLLRRRMPETDVLAYSFRAIAPLFAGNRIYLNGLPKDDEKRIQLWATDEGGRLAMKAEAILAADAPGGGR